MKSALNILFSTITRKSRYSYLFLIIFLHSLFFKFFLFKTIEDKEILNVFIKIDLYSIILVTLSAIVLIETEVYFVNKYIKLKNGEK